MGTLRGRPDLERPAFTTRDPLSDAHGMPLPSRWQKGAGATWAATPLHRPPRTIPTTPTWAPGVPHRTYRPVPLCTAVARARVVVRGVSTRTRGRRG